MVELQGQGLDGADEWMVRGKGERVGLRAREGWGEARVIGGDDVLVDNRHNKDDSSGETLKTQQASGEQTNYCHPEHALGASACALPEVALGVSADEARRSEDAAVRGTPRRQRQVSGCLRHFLANGRPAGARSHTQRISTPLRDSFESVDAV